jgi:hypothetical protein
MGEEGSSTDHSRLLQYGRWGRERILNETGVFSRMQASARDDYFHGRIARVFLTSAVWNLYHREISNALSRTMFAFLALILAGTRTLSLDYWHALAKPYVNQTFARGFDEEPIPRTRQL